MKKEWQDRVNELAAERVRRDAGYVLSERDVLPASRFAAEKARAEEIREHTEFAKETEAGIDKLTAALAAAEKRAEEAERKYRAEQDAAVRCASEATAFCARVEELEGLLNRAYIQCGRDPVLSADIRAALSGEEER